MWKYRCKSQLIALIASFLMGVILSAFTFQNNMAMYETIMPEEMYNLAVNNTLLMYISSGFVVSGFVNVFLVTQLLMAQFNVSPIVVFMFLFLLPDYVLIIGTLLVIPMALLSIYGMISLSLEEKRNFSRQNIDSQAELVRIYSIHHKLVEDVKPMAEECRKNVDRMTSLYVLGMIAIGSIIVFVDNFLIWMLSLLFFMFVFNALLRYRAQSFLPITALLYEQCDPEACASAIIYFSTRKGKIKIKNQTLLAQCLIYMDDPELAQDFLINYPRRDASSSLNYWSLMGYINYLLKDEDALHRCKEEASKIRLGFGQTGVMIQSVEVGSIQNKIDLMDGELNTCKKYYLQSLQRAQFNFQVVDASYYIALISFVEEDYVVARLYFNKVLQIGNKMSLVEKAQKYQEKMDAMHLDEESEILA